VFAINISFINFTFDSTYIGWLTNLTYIVGFIFLVPKVYDRGRNIEFQYVFVMLLGLLFHFFLPDSKMYPISDALKWVFCVVLIIAARKYRPPSLFFHVLLVFYISHCLIALVEYKTQSVVFDYSFVEKFSSSFDSNGFRAFGLMEHPLYSANVTVIIMSFIMISENMKGSTKAMLLTLGTLALICFNSRSAMVIWGVLLLYRYIFYNIKPIYTILLGVLIYSLFLSDIMAIIQNNASVFGRLAKVDSLTDESSLTRLLSYVFFWEARWNVQDIVYGGRVIYMPGTEVSLENGILLTISWWGWIVGTCKVVLELLISYRCLGSYIEKDKWIVMIACWGVAFANNNSFNTFVFVFFIFSYISVSSLANKKNKKRISYIPT
jgi:hypothetical protein